MTDKETIINKVNVNRCSVYKNGLCLISKEKCNAKCDYAAYYLYEQLERKEQEYEELRQYHNKCCKEFENEKQALLEKYNQVSINFYNGDYCNTEHCSLLKAKEQECGELKERIKCNCFDPKSNNNRCISYNRIAEDYERDLKRLENKIAECEKYEGAFRRIKKQSKINCEEICGKSYEACDDKDCLAIQIRDIINKAKENK